MNGRSGRWKEGRAGGASLIYLRPAWEWLEVVAQHHAAVGIRATLACHVAEPRLRRLVERNWDIAACEGADAALVDELRALDGRDERAWVGDAPPGAHVLARPLYHVGTAAGPVASPEPALTEPLPSMAAPDTVEGMQQAIEDVVQGGGWALWRCDAAWLQRITPVGHARLLTWLGEHHARIWCAPVRDIATWRKPA